VKKCRNVNPDGWFLVKHSQLEKFSRKSEIAAAPFWDGKAAERIVGVLAK
jgi:hypothetical protein